MPIIELIDFLGDYWRLSWVKIYNTNTVTGTMEAWVYVEKGPRPFVDTYDAIPIPVFTGWWE